MNSTLVPFCTILASARTSQLVRRTQPCDSVLLLLRLHPLKLELRAVVVGGILGDRTDGAGPAGSGPLLAADRSGVEVHQLAAAVQGADRSCRFVHHHLCDLRL